MYRLLLLCLLLNTSLHSYSQKLLKDIASSDASSNINQNFTDFSNYLIKGDTLFFIAEDSTSTTFRFKNIWFTTGTAANTKKITNGYQTSLLDSYIFLTSFKGKAYYRDVANSSLYATDGNSITVVKTFNNSTIQKAGVLNGWLYVFVSNNSPNSLELWKTDGTEANTTKVTDVYVGSHSFNTGFIFNSGDKLYFNVNTSATGYETWITDGSASGTKLLKDILPGPGTASPRGFVKVGNTVFFVAADANFYSKLWKTDGTEAGTTLVTNTINGSTSYYVNNTISFNNQLYFTVDGNLYKTDGSTTILVKAGFALYGQVVRTDNLMYFMSISNNTFELWKSDGTTNGTEKITNILSHPEYYYVNVKLLAGSSKVYFQLSTEKNSGFENITQHWVSDGTVSGTMNINTLNTTYSTGSANNQVAVLGDTYYFVAYDGTNGFELWKSDGTNVGTMLVKNINEAIASSNPSQFAILGNNVFFSADDVKHGREIWKTDGTTSNTNLLADYNSHRGSDINYSAEIAEMIAYNDIIIAQIAFDLVKFSATMPPTPYFSANSLTYVKPEFIRYANKIYFKCWDNANNGYELFVTDGTTTTKVKDFSTDYFGGEPSNFIIWNGLLYFTTNNNQQIWKSDGTEAGTILVKAFIDGGVLSKLYDTNNLLLFERYSPAEGNELWKTDGTEAGTALVKDINPHGFSDIQKISSYNNNLYFVATNGSTYNFYKSDGSSANTQVFGSVVSENTPIVFKNKLFFIAKDMPGNVFWLWSTDGVSVPVKVQQLAETIVNPEAVVMKNVNNKLLVFDIIINSVRHELWASDGTTAGTQLAKVIRQKEMSNSYYMNIVEYVYNNSKLYFAANDGIHGRELWVWDLDCMESLTLVNAISQDTDFKVDKFIVGSNTINTNVKASYNANKFISLNPGFETKAGSRFTATLSGCVNVEAASNSTANEPFFKHVSTKGDYKPTIIQFLTNPVNIELLEAYKSEENNQNEQNIAWIFDESSTQYVLKMRVSGKEWIGYLPK